jgi:AcrR family transcriptional regulator
MARRYELKKRADRKAETRRRIVEAAVDLHTTVGPSQTSIASIAQRAGVQRHTVYAHFPDEPSLFAACTSHWAEKHPFPDPAAWERIDDPERRLRTALEAVYGWYDRVEPDLALFARDATLVASYRFATEAQTARRRALADDLALGLPGRRRLVRAAVGHALEFETWRSLVRREGLMNRQAANVMVALATGL